MWNVVDEKDKERFLEMFRANNLLTDIHNISPTNVLVRGSAVRKFGELAKQWSRQWDVVLVIEDKAIKFQVPWGIENGTWLCGTNPNERIECVNLLKTNLVILLKR